MSRSRSDDTPTIHTKSIVDFLIDVWGTHANGGDFYVFIGWKSRHGWRQVALSESNAYDRLPHLIEKYSDHDLYFCPNLFRQPKRQRRYALPSSWGWCDIDGGRLSAFPIQPTIAWMTSHGRHQGLWLWDCKERRDRAELYARALAQYSDDGSGWEITKMLRIPGTYNYKRARPHLVTIVREQWDGDWTAISERPNTDALPTQLNGEAGDIDLAAVSKIDRYAVRRKFPRVRHLLDDEPEDTSGRMYLIAKEMAKRGTPEEIAAVIMGSAAWRGMCRKRGERDAFRVLRITTSKVQATLGK